MNNKFFILSLFIISSVCYSQNNNTSKNQINTVIDAWHQAAANANFDKYFSYMSEDAVFIGTDATENWNKKEFKAYAKPHFDKGKAWSFTPLERNIYFSADKKMAWFDELLDTQMKICRGSGILIKENNEWKIAHYVISIAIPNDFTQEVVRVKAESDEKFIQKLKH
jgi:hypothetical protein